MQCMVIDAETKLVPMDSRWVIHAMFRKNLGPLAMLTVAVLVGVWFFVPSWIAIPLPSDGPLSWVMGVCFFFFIVVPLSEIVSPLALRAFLRRPELRRYYHDVLEEIQRRAKHPYPEDTNWLSAALLEYMETRSEPSAIALRFNDTMFWHKGFSASCHLYFTHPDTNKASYFRHANFQTLDLSKTSWRTRFFHWLAISSPHGRNAMVLFALDSHFVGSAHEQIQHQANLEAHKAALLAS